MQFWIKSTVDRCTCILFISTQYSCSSSCRSNSRCRPMNSSPDYERATDARPLNLADKKFRLAADLWCTILLKPVSPMTYERFQLLLNNVFQQFYISSTVNWDSLLTPKKMWKIIIKFLCPHSLSGTLLNIIAFRMS